MAEPQPRSPGGQLVPVRGPDGTIGTIPAAQADDAIASGNYKPVTTEEFQKADLEAKYGGIGGAAKAAAMGFGRGLTLGGLDVAGRAIGGEGYRQTAEGLREANPTASIGGELAGAIAPSLIPGGAELEGASLGARSLRAATALPRAVGELGGLAERGVAGLVGEGAASLGGRILQRGAALGAQGAVEGSIYGAGSGLSEAALGEPDMTAEKLFASMGEGAKSGAMFGAIGGAGLGALGETAGAIGNKAVKLFDESSLADYFKSFANERTIKAVGATSRDINKMSDAELANVAETVRGYKFDDGERLFKAGDSVADLAEKTGRAVEEQGARLGDIRDKLESVVQAKPSLGPDLQGALGKIDTDVIAPLRASNIGDVAAKADKVESTIAKLRERAAPQTPPELRQLEEQFPNFREDSQLMAQIKVKQPEAFAQLEAKPISLKELTTTRQELDSIIYPKSKGNGLPPLPPEHKAELIQVRRILEDEIESATKRAAEATQNPGLMDDYLEAKAKYKAMRMANDMAEAGAGRSLGNRIVSPTDYLTGVGSGIGALAHGVSGLGGAAIGLGSAALHHVVREHGNSVLALAADRLAQISERTAGVDSQISQAIDKFTAAGKSSVFKGLSEMPTLQPQPHGARDNFDAARNQVMAAAANPAQVQANLGHTIGPIAHAAPQTAVALTTTASRAAAFLHSKLPQAHPGTLAMPAPVRPHEDPIVKSTFMRYERGANRPLTLASDLPGRKPLTPQHVEAVKTVAPLLHERITTMARQKVAESAALGKHPTYEQRIKLSVLLGEPMDPTLQPENIAIVQDMYASTPGGASKEGGAPSTAAPTRKLNIASSFRSGSEPSTGA